MLLDAGVRVALFYGDADYICNWFGGQAISLAVNYTHSAQFAAAGYQPFTVDGGEYGEVRQYGNFSFLRIYEAGHEVPYYQRKSYSYSRDWHPCLQMLKPETALASLAMFNRTINHMNIADGTLPVTESLSSSGGPNATHTEPFVALPSSTSAAASTGTAGAFVAVPKNW